VWDYNINDYEFQTKYIWNITDKLILEKTLGVYPKIYVAKTKDVNFDTTNGLRIAGGWIVPNTFTFIVNYNWNTQDLVITLSYTKYEARNEKVS